MPRTHFHASALALFCLLGTTACAVGAPPPYVGTSPTPEPVAPLPDSTPAPVAVEPEKVDEGLDLERVRNATVGRELLGTASYDLPVEPNQWVSMELSFLVNQRHDVVARWLERSERYAQFVQETFAAAGIPRDLHHLAMVESGYQPTARSHAGAVGMWQFMSATGRGMGLRIDDQVDERMDPVRSTRAAARHLKQLYGDFGGNWALAAAAYNAGGGRISRGLASYGATDFWDLAQRGNLAQETRRYVPRLYAVTIIAKDPARFGYARPGGVVRRFEFDSIQVDLPTPLPVLARIGGVQLGELAELNPHLYRGMVPGFYWLWVPRGQGSGLQQAYATSEYRRRGGFQWYTLRRGEDARNVALASNLTLDQLRELNLSTSLDQLGRGDRIRLYADAVRALDTRPVERLARGDDDGDDASPRRARRSSESDDDDADESSARRSRASASDDDAPSTRRRSSPGDDSPRRSRVSSSGDDSPRRSRVSSSDDDSPRRSRASSSDDDSAPRSRTASSDDENASTRRRSSSDEDSPRRSRTASSEGESPRRSRNSSSDDDDAPSRGRRQEESTSSRSPILRHTVEAGETLLAIGRKYEVTLAQLLEANDLGANAVLQPGQKLRIPRASQRSSGSERGESRAASSERRSSGETRTASSERRRSGDETRPERLETRTASSSRARQHVVKTGETLWSIARSYDTTVAAIRDANDMRADSVLQPGQTLRIPRPAPARSSDDR
ncbi:MAG TPA: LysM peptidoglycan-binding domain-containing protein [Longimicrobium sp.]|nr:LysM peptidoglycan-binding domain-containing protein [Longimicrobium sp.]